MTEHRVIIEQGTPLQKQVFWVAFLIILGIMFWEYAVAILGVTALGVGIYLGVRQANARKAQLLANAERQRNWYEQGDPRAYYGPDYTGGLDEGPIG